MGKRRWRLDAVLVYVFQQLVKVTGFGGTIFRPVNAERYGPRDLRKELVPVAVCDKPACESFQFSEVYIFGNNGK